MSLSNEILSLKSIQFADFGDKTSFTLVSPQQYQNFKSGNRIT